VNEYGLFDLYNLKPTAACLVPYDPVFPFVDETTLNLAGLSGVWPFPQLFFGKKYTILADRTRIFFIDRNDPNNVWYEPALYDANDSGHFPMEIPAGNPWSFADFQDSWVLTNGECVVFFPGVDEMQAGYTPLVYVNDQFKAKTVAAFKGRCIFGGLDYNNFWTSEQETFWKAWFAKYVAHGLTHTKTVGGAEIFAPVDSNFILWTQVGGGDLMFWLFPKFNWVNSVIEKGYTDSSYDSTKPFILDLWLRNDQGWGPVDGEAVRAFLPLGENLMCYTDNRVIALFNDAAHATIGQRVVYEGGILGHGAVAGDYYTHCFVDQGGELVRIGADLKAQVEGYREFLWPLIGDGIMVHHSKDPRDLKGIGEFYICTENKTFVFNGELYETGQQVKSAHYLKSMTVGITGYYEDGADEGRVGIDLVNYLDPGFKQMDQIQLYFEEETIGGSAAQIRCAVDYRYSTRHDRLESGWSTSPYKLVNNNGDCYIGVSGLDFKLRIKSDDYNKLKRIWAYTPVVKFVDRRFRRSVDLGQAGG